jgi:VWFA-related protein
MRAVLRLAPVAAFLALTGFLAAQSPPPSQPPAQAPAQPPARVPTFRSGVDIVRVDVIVTDRKGQPVAGLTRDDFEVTERGEPQAIESFKLVSVSGEARPGDPPPPEIRSEYDEESEAARDDVRLFVIFLDDYHVRRSSAIGARRALTSFLQKQLGPLDLCGIMYPEIPVSAMVLGRNRQAMAAAINRFEGRKYDYQPKFPFEEQYSMYPAATVEYIRNQASLSALESLVTHLGSLREGRKAVILVSEGYTGLLPAQLNDPVAAMPGAGNPYRNASGMESGDDRSAFFARIDIQDLLRPVYDAANRGNTAIYALAPRGLSTGEFDITEGVGPQTDRQILVETTDTLRSLAGETDGRAIVNRNDLEGALQQVVRDSSAYYLLGYSTTHAAPDGKFHEIKVKVRRAGLQVRARRGYWALTREEMARALAPSPAPLPAPVSKALGSLAEPKRGRFIREWFGTAKGERGRTKVTFVWDPQPPVPGAGSARPVSVTLEAGRAGRAFFRGRVGTPPDPGLAAFDADPGPLEIRVVVQGEGGETLDSETRELAVPDLTRADVALSTPAVFRTSTGREFQALLANPSPVPTPAREFRRTERLLVRFEAYAAGAEAASVSARVLNRMGKAMAELAVTGPREPATFRQVDLPLAGFAAGEYLIEVMASLNGSEATELVPIKVGG